MDEALIFVQDAVATQNSHAAILSENVALRAQITELRKDFNLLRQDVDVIKQRLFMNRPLPLFGGASKVRPYLGFRV